MIEDWIYPLTIALGSWVICGGCIFFVKLSDLRTERRDCERQIIELLRSIERELKYKSYRKGE